MQEIHQHEGETKDKVCNTFAKKAEMTNSCQRINSDQNKKMQ